MPAKSIVPRPAARNPYKGGAATDTLVRYRTREEPQHEMSTSVSPTQTPRANTAADPAVVPSVPSDIALPTVDGATLRLADLRGKDVLLFCWASW